MVGFCGFSIISYLRNKRFDDRRIMGKKPKALGRKEARSCDRWRLMSFRVLAASLEEAHELGAKCAGQTVRVIEQ